MLSYNSHVVAVTHNAVHFGSVALIRSRGSYFNKDIIILACKMHHN